MSIRRFCIAFLAGWVLTVTALAVDSRFLGTWKLNGEKSKLEGSGIGSNATARLEPDGSGFKASVEAPSPEGQSISYTYQLTLDSKPIKVAGAAQFDEIASSRVNDRVFTATAKKNGQVVYSDRRALSRDGKTITITRKGTNPQGHRYTATIVFDKQ